MKNKFARSVIVLQYKNMSEISQLIQSYNEVVECYEIDFIFTEIEIDLEEEETHVKNVRDSVILNFEQFENNVINNTLIYIEDKEDMKQYFNKLINNKLPQIDVKALNKNIELTDLDNETEHIKIMVKNNEIEPDEYTENPTLINYAYILSVRKID